MQATFKGVPDAPVIALAKLRLSKSKLKMPCETRAQALNILRCIQPAPPKNAPLNIKPAPVVHEACRKCGNPIPFGTPCKVCFHGEIPEHIQCKRVSIAKRKEEAALRKLYLEAVKQVTW